MNDYKNQETVEQLKSELRAALGHTRGVDAEHATIDDMYWAASVVMRDHLSDKQVKTMNDTVNGRTKAVGYLSAEYLLGDQLENAVLDAGLASQFGQALKELGFDLEEVESREIEPGLGNGGLGRLAACYIDSLATLGVPAMGYGIRYSYGIFRQKFNEAGEQVELPDRWLKRGNPWERINYRCEQRVGFGGTVEEGENGSRVWKPAWEVRALPYDYLVPGYRSGRVNTLRLWSSRAVDEFDLQAFNRSEYDNAVLAQTAAENISKVLYPEDSTEAGKRLRLEQQYFFCAASLKDAISLFFPNQEHPDLTMLPSKIVFQLNDTHPVIAIAELMRIMIDEYGYDWDVAWETTRRTFNYTCHTLLPEALEIWSADLLSSLLPRHMEIIRQISDWAADDERKNGAGADQIERMRVTTGDQVRMAYLATITSEHVNGVAKLHSELLKESVLKDYAEVYPDKFTNVTNGVTPRRFIRLANPRLAELISDGLGSDAWLRDLNQLHGLVHLADDPDFVDRFADVKRANKRNFVAWLKRTQGIDVDIDSMFDTMIKRLHEYKRQSLKILQVIALYSDMKSGRTDVNAVLPRTIIFGAKSAPGYAMAKLTIKLINNVARVINSDPDIKGKLQVVFVPNYNVANAEHIIPATDLDEQISLAGKEASGTSNMKFAMNGALTVGTLDGANVEIREHVGAENFYLFGMTVEQVEELGGHYNPYAYYESDPQLKNAIDMIANGTFSDGDPHTYEMFVNDLLHNDRFMALADFRAYMDIQAQIEDEFRHPGLWFRKALLNVANSGYFSSDRSIRDYLDRIWFTGMLPME